MSTKELVREIRRTTKKAALLQSKLLRRSADSEALQKRASILKSTAGALKKRIKGNVVSWQKKQRKEWDR